MWEIRAKKWIEEEGSFLAGIALLQEKGISTRQMEPRSKKHLVTPEMKAQVRNQVERLLKETPSVQDRPSLSQRPLPLREKDPPEVEKLHDRGKRLMKQRSRLHAMLCSASSDEERYDIAYEMCVKIQPQIDQVYGAIRAWEEEGALPASADQDDIVQATVKKMLRRDSLKVRLSQLRSKLRKKELDAAARQQYEEEIDEKTKELDGLEAQLGL